MYFPLLAGYKKQDWTSAWVITGRFVTSQASESTAQEQLSLPDGSGRLESILCLSQTRLFPHSGCFLLWKGNGNSKIRCILDSEQSSQEEVLGSVQEPLLKLLRACHSAEWRAQSHLLGFAASLDLQTPIQLQVPQKPCVMLPRGLDGPLPEGTHWGKGIGTGFMQVEYSVQPNKEYHVFHDSH